MRDAPGCEGDEDRSEAEGGGGGVEDEVFVGAVDWPGPQTDITEMEGGGMRHPWNFNLPKQWKIRKNLRAVV